MKYLLKVCIHLLLTTWFSTTLGAQININVEITDSNLTCGSTSTSYICVSISGADPSQYTYYWTHGPSALCIYNVSFGEVYTLVVVDNLGCEQTFEFPIEGTSGDCSIEALVGISSNCQAFVSIEVFGGGTMLSPGQYVLTDGTGQAIPNNFTLPIYTYAYVYTVEAYVPSLCCTATYEIELEGMECDKQQPCREKLIVNEFARGLENQFQFVELMVVGECECGGKTDIRRAILDDNNGELIPFKSTVKPLDLLEGGANLGYLRFSEHDQWAAVPNGSLIVILPEGDIDGDELPELDPSDQNQDNVYVLQADDSGLLVGQLTSWSLEGHKLYYSDILLQESSWELIDISEKADGVQVRSGSGAFEHGMSLGQNAFTTTIIDTTTFEGFYVTDQSPDGRGCRLFGSALQELDSYNCSPLSVDEATPGVPNSFNNEAFRENLRRCVTEESEVVFLKTQQKQEENSIDRNKRSSSGEVGRVDNLKPIVAASQSSLLDVYPNPYEDQFTCMYRGHQRGKFTISLYSAAGVPVYQSSHNALQENTEQIRFQITPTQAIGSGLYFVEVVLPNGERLGHRISKFRR